MTLKPVLKLRRPSDAWLKDLAEAQRDEPFAYDAVGATAAGHERPAGYRHDHHEIDLGSGDETFERATACLQQWIPQRGSGLAFGATTPQVEPGTTVALAAPTPVGHVVATCRVVYVEAEDDHYAWAYGSLPIHPERGEERFAVTRDPLDGRIRFEVDVVWKLHHPLARLAPPIARRLQARATVGYLEAMKASSAS